eukprot:TRINITY_DN5901_c0_g1_i3.p1 TRINITY_DN5901_c0_g1~~TRINITY_DN5901_c0_g1_i3.p1  ORF type:complete len:763 (+),score=167.89 TRINITY_DN5901_c0_g1_i3:74-2290(+)
MCIRDRYMGSNRKMIQVKAASSKSMTNALARARQTGVLNLPNAGMTTFPPELCNFDNVVYNDQKWWELVPLTKIDLSNNEIAEIPPGVAGNTDLVALRLVNNRVTALPDELFTLQGLKSLDMGKNKLRSLPEGIYRGHALVELLLNDNELTRLPMSFSSLPNLEVLVASNNQIASLPDDFGRLRRLKRLDLSSNALERVPFSLSMLSDTLEHLILSKNRITELDFDTLRPLRALIFLDLSHNRLSEFNEFPMSSRLDSVILAYNRISAFEGFEECKGITVLDLKYNKIALLPKTIARLPTLKTLDVSNNDLSDVPNELGFMTSLVRIALEGNPLKAIRSSVRQAGAEVVKRYLRDRQAPETAPQATREAMQEFNAPGAKDLDPWLQLVRDFTNANQELRANGLQLRAIDDRIGQLTSLIVLDLSKNELTEVTRALSKCSSLAVLRLNENKIETFPTYVFLSLAALRELELSHNRLNSLCDDIQKAHFAAIPRLKTLNVAANKLKAIPHWLPYLTSIQTVNLAYNSIAHADELFCESTSALEAVDLSNNKLEDINEAAAYFCPRLGFLNLENNSLTRLPTELGFKTVLKSLKVDGNPLKLMKRATIEKGTVAILDHLRNRHVGEQPQFNVRARQEETKMEVEPPRQQYQQPEMEFTLGRHEPPTPPSAASRFERPSASTSLREPVRDNRAREEELRAIDAALTKLERELEDNFALSKPQIAAKRREMNDLKVRRAQLLK